jgi:hypothetical protein
MGLSYLDLLLRRAWANYWSFMWGQLVGAIFAFLCSLVALPIVRLLQKGTDVSRDLLQLAANGLVGPVIVFGLGYFVAVAVTTARLHDEATGKVAASGRSIPPIGSAAILLYAFVAILFAWGVSWWSASHERGNLLNSFNVQAGALDKERGAFHLQQLTTEAWKARAGRSRPPPRPPPQHLPQLVSYLGQYGLHLIPGRPDPAIDYFVLGISNASEDTIVPILEKLRIYTDKGTLFAISNMRNKFISKGGGDQIFVDIRSKPVTVPYGTTRVFVEFQVSADTVPSTAKRSSFKRIAWDLSWPEGPGSTPGMAQRIVDEH